MRWLLLIALLMFAGCDGNKSTAYDLGRTRAHLMELYDSAFVHRDTVMLNLVSRDIHKIDSAIVNIMTHNP